MNTVFKIVYSILAVLAVETGLTYNEINIVVYYCFIPLVYLFLVDRIIKKPVCTISFIVAWCVLLVTMPDFSAFSDHIFNGSVAFLEAFSAIGWNYAVASVMICVVVPVPVFLVLLYFAYPNLFRRSLGNARELSDK